MNQALVPPLLFFLHLLGGAFGAPLLMVYRDTPNPLDDLIAASRKAIALPDGPVAFFGPSHNWTPRADCFDPTDSDFDLQLKNRLSTEPYSLIVIASDASANKRASLLMNLAFDLLAHSGQLIVYDFTEKKYLVAMRNQ